jgi:hypothetical protein
VQKLRLTYITEEISHLKTRRSQSKSGPLVALLIILLGLAFCSSEALAQPQDYFQRLGTLFMSPFGENRQTDEQMGFDYVSLPPVVAPGQQVAVNLQWGFLNPHNPNAVMYLNAFGDWQPGSALARLVSGQLVGGSTTSSNSFTFRAPVSPGHYRIRIPLALAHAPVTNFFGAPDRGDLSPGPGAAYTEVGFAVAMPSVQDYFQTLGTLFMSPFGENRQTDEQMGFDFVSLPPVVAPGQQVPVNLQWSFLNPHNPNAVMYLNAFGDWQPGNALASLVSGQLVGGSSTASKSFSFRAPVSPGQYRIRIPLALAHAPVTNFFGAPNGGDLNPGPGAAYTELGFTVVVPGRVGTGRGSSN